MGPSVGSESDSAVLVVIPAFNAESYLAQAIESVMAQTHSRWELVVVDNGSSDETLRIAQDFESRDARIRVLHIAANVGPARARNLGAGLCSAANLAFLDADDVWEPSCLAQLLRTLTVRNDASAALGRVEFINDQGHNVRMSTLLAGAKPWYGRRFGIPGSLRHGEDVDFRALATSCCIRSPGAVLVRTRDFLAVGGFDPAMGHCADWDLWLSLARRGPIATTDVHTLNYRWHGSNMSLDTAASADSSERVLHKARSLSDNTPSQSRALKRGYRARHLVHAASKIGLASNAALNRRWRETIDQIRHSMGHVTKAIYGSPRPRRSGDLTLV